MNGYALRSKKEKCACDAQCGSILPTVDLTIESDDDGCGGDLDSPNECPAPRRRRQSRGAIGTRSFHKKRKGIHAKLAYDTNDGNTDGQAYVNTKIQSQGRDECNSALTKASMQEPIRRSEENNFSYTGGKGDETSEKFHINEKIFAWDKGALCKARVLKCKHDSGGSEYYVHYLRNRKSHDRWLASNDMMQMTPFSRKFYFQSKGLPPEAGMRVNVEFEGAEVYGGRIANVEENKSEQTVYHIEIHYDDGETERTTYPDPEISLLPNGKNTPFDNKTTFESRGLPPKELDNQRDLRNCEGQKKIEQDDIQPEIVVSNESCGNSPYDKEDYASLRQRYLLPRIREKAELAGGITLRRQRKARMIDQQSPGFRMLRSQVDALLRKEDHAEVYRLLCQLRRWEMDPRRVPAAFRDVNKGDVAEIVDLTNEKEDDGSYIDVDEFITDVLLVDVKNKGKGKVAPLQTPSKSLPDIVLSSEQIDQVSFDDNPTNTCNQSFAESSVDGEDHPETTTHCHNSTPTVVDYNGKQVQPDPAMCKEPSLLINERAIPNAHQVQITHAAMEDLEAYAFKLISYLSLAADNGNQHLNKETTFESRGLLMKEEENRRDQRNGKRRKKIKRDDGDLSNDEENYASLRQRYLLPRIREKAELAGGITLRRQRKARMIDQQSPGFRMLRSQVDRLLRKEDHAEVYRLLSQLRRWEMDPRRVPAAFRDVSKGDVAEIVDLSKEEEDGSGKYCIDVDEFITDVLLVDVKNKGKGKVSPLQTPSKSLPDVVPSRKQVSQISFDNNPTNNCNQSFVESSPDGEDHPETTVHNLNQTIEDCNVKQGLPNPVMCKEPSPLINESAIPKAHQVQITVNLAADNSNQQNFRGESGSAILLPSHSSTTTSATTELKIHPSVPLTPVQLLINLYNGPTIHQLSTHNPEFQSPLAFGDVRSDDILKPPSQLTIDKCRKNYVQPKWKGQPCCESNEKVKSNPTPKYNAENPNPQGPDKFEEGRWDGFPKRPEQTPVEKCQEFHVQTKSIGQPSCESNEMNLNFSTQNNADLHLESPPPFTKWEAIPTSPGRLILVECQGDHFQTKSIGHAHCESSENQLNPSTQHNSDVRLQSLFPSTKWDDIPNPPGQLMIDDKHQKLHAQTKSTRQPHPQGNEKKVNPSTRISADFRLESPSQFTTGKDTPKPTIDVNHRKNHEQTKDTDQPRCESSEKKTLNPSLQYTAGLRLESPPPFTKWEEIPKPPGQLSSGACRDGHIHTKSKGSKTLPSCTKTETGCRFGSSTSHFCDLTLSTQHFDSKRQPGSAFAQQKELNSMHSRHSGLLHSYGPGDQQFFNHVMTKEEEYDCASILAGLMPQNNTYVPLSSQQNEEMLHSQLTAPTIHTSRVEPQLNPQLVLPKVEKGIRDFLMFDKQHSSLTDEKNDCTGAQLVTPEIPRIAAKGKKSSNRTSLHIEWKKQVRRRRKGQWIPSGHITGRWKPPKWADIKNDVRAQSVSLTNDSKQKKYPSCKKSLLPKLDNLVSRFSAEMDPKYELTPCPLPGSLRDVICPQYFKPTFKLLQNAHAAMRDLLPKGDCEDWEVVELARHYFNYWRPKETKIILLAESHSFTQTGRALNGPGLDKGILEGYDGPREFLSHVYCLAYGENESLAGQASDHQNKGTPQFWTLFAACARGVEYVATTNSEKTFSSPFAADLLKGGGLSVEERLKAKLEVLRDLHRRGVWLLDASIFGWYINQPPEYSISSISHEVHRKSKRRPPKELKIPSLVLSWELFTKHLVRDVAEEGNLKLLIPIGMEVEAALTRERMENAIKGMSGVQLAESFPAPNAWIPGGYGPFHAKLSTLVNEAAPRVCFKTTGEIELDLSSAQEVISKADFNILCSSHAEKPADDAHFNNKVLKFEGEAGCVRSDLLPGRRQPEKQFVSWLINRKSKWIRQRQRNRKVPWFGGLK